MLNKNKYSAIFGLCCMLSCRVGAAASSSSTGDLEHSSEQQKREKIFHCYTTEKGQSSSSLTKEINPMEITVSNFSGELISEYEGDGKFCLIIGNEKFPGLSLGNTYVCFSVEENAISIRVIKFILDSIDTTKNIHSLIRSSRYLKKYESIAKFDHHLHTFCLESIWRLRSYIKHNPKEVLPLIREYTDEIATLFQSIDKELAIAILENDPDLLNPNNLEKFSQKKFHCNYKILRIMKQNKAVEEKIADLRAL